MIELLGYLRYILHAYWWVVIAAAVMSWLIGFNVINFSNPSVRQVWKVLMALTEPLLAPIRRVLPSTGGLDFSPIILLFGVIGIADFLIPFLMRMVA